MSAERWAANDFQETSRRPLGELFQGVMISCLSSGFEPLRRNGRVALDALNGKIAQVRTCDMGSTLFPTAFELGDATEPDGLLTVKPTLLINTSYSQPLDPNTMEIDMNRSLAMLAEYVNNGFSDRLPRILNKAFAYQSMYMEYRGMGRLKSMFDPRYDDRTQFSKELLGVHYDFPISIKDWLSVIDEQYGKVSNNEYRRRLSYLSGEKRFLFERAAHLVEALTYLPDNMSDTPEDERARFAARQLLSYSVEGLEPQLTPSIGLPDELLTLVEADVVFAG